MDWALCGRSPGLPASPGAADAVGVVRSGLPDASSAWRAFLQVSSISPGLAARVTDTAHGPHSQTSRLSWNARQIVRTCAMGLPHPGQGAGLELAGNLSD